MFSQFIYQKNKKRLFLCQNVNKNKLIKAKGCYLQFHIKRRNFSFILKEDYGKFFQSDKGNTFPYYQIATLPYYHITICISDGSFTANNQIKFVHLRRIKRRTYKQHYNFTIT